MQSLHDHDDDDADVNDSYHDDQKEYKYNVCLKPNQLLETKQRERERDDAEQYDITYISTIS